MDNRKIVKDFIDYISNWIEDEYKNHGNIGFWHEIHNDKLSYLVADKGIDKRIQKQLFKKLGLKSKVDYELNISEYTYPNGELKIKLYKEEVYKYENIVRPI
jgi:hypothetical protein